MSEHDAEAYTIAWMMFARRCELDEADMATANQAWQNDADIRAFWLDEAQHVMDALAEVRGRGKPDEDPDIIGGPDGVGWWVIDDDRFRASMSRAADGEDVDLILLELYANSAIEKIGEGD